MKNSFWFEKNRKLLMEIQDQLKYNYPTLQLVIEKRKVFIRGSLYIFIPNSKEELDRFGIEIELPDNYPLSVPLVREVEDRIPKTLTRHFFVEGIACLFFRDEEYKFYNKKTLLVDFIKIPVYNFFLSQAYFELTGKWLFGERHHGDGAIWEYYAEELGTNNLDIIIRFLFLLSSRKVDVKNKCYCGSNHSLNQCHIDKLMSMRENISIQKAKVSLLGIINIRKAVYQSIKEFNLR